MQNSLGKDVSLAESFSSCCHEHLRLPEPPVAPPAPEDLGAPQLDPAAAAVTPEHLRGQFPACLPTWSLKGPGALSPSSVPHSPASASFPKGEKLRLRLLLPTGLVVHFPLDWTNPSR